MINSYDQTVLHNYLTRLLFDSRMTHKMYSEVCDWFEDHLEDIVSTEISDETWAAIGDYNCAIGEHSNTVSAQKKFLTAISQLFVTNKETETTSSQLEITLAILASETKLDESDKAIFSLIARYKTSTILENLLGKLTGCGCHAPLIISLLTGIDEDKVSKRLDINEKLVSSGLVQLKKNKESYLPGRLDMSNSILKTLLASHDKPDDIYTQILGRPLRAELDWDDFSHLGGDHNRLLSFLNKSRQQGVRGINILLWGSSGAGKTEFCKTLAKELSCNLYAVGETDDDGNEPDRQERLDAMQLAQGLLQYQDNSLLMFDEMDNMAELSSFSAYMGDKLLLPSKVLPNRLFENNPVPTLWIINDVSALEESTIRRMSLVLEIKNPPKSSLPHVWNRISAVRGLNLPAQNIAELMTLETSPVVLDNAVRFAQINGQGTDDILFAVRGVIKAVKGSIKPMTAISYCSDLVNADMNLNALGAQLKKSGQRQFSLCLYGNPGTGKTEYVRQLAEQLGMEVLVKRASDLLDTKIGETEQRIAAAFQEAQAKESFLIFDEADSLLGDRRHAQRSWEISQVNEMLTWMESHPLPFACTTNLMERLDQASLRRFTFKVGFSALTQAQNSLAFKQFFGIQAPKEIGTFTNLTPGDFAVVQKKAAIMETFDQPEELIKMLKVESSVKSNDANPIGFAMN